MTGVQILRKMIWHDAMELINKLEDAVKNVPGEAIPQAIKCARNAVEHHDAQDVLRCMSLLRGLVDRHYITCRRPRCHSRGTRGGGMRIHLLHRGSLGLGPEVMALCNRLVPTSQTTVWVLKSTCPDCAEIEIAQCKVDITGYRQRIAALEKIRDRAHG